MASVEQSVLSNEEYLEKKIRCLIEPLITSLLIEKPKEPVWFMIEWLQNYSGVGNSSGVNAERAELQFLRKEMVKLNKKYKEETNATDHETESEEDDEEIDKFEEELKQRKAKALSKGQRVSVSAESYGNFNKKNEDFVPKVIPKSKEQKLRISATLAKSILFSTLADKEKETVLLAFVEQKVQNGDLVIKQGDQGDVLFLIESGYYECFKQFKKDQEQVLVKKYGPGDFFGELALLYNAPRAASVYAKSDDCVVWALDRETFNHIVKDASVKKREKYSGFLKSVEILKPLNEYEINQIADAIKEEKFEKDNEVIIQGQIGDKFYILEEGIAIALKSFEEGEKEQVLKYIEGSYFGELALIKGEPRAATVKTQTACTFLSLERDSFKRLLGPIETHLKKNSELYQKFSKKS